MDVALVGYDVELVTESGTVYDLNNALISLMWEEQEGQLAQKAVVTVINFQTGSGYLMSLAKLNCVIRIYAHWGAERQKMFEGAIWEWSYSSAQTKELTLTVCDPMVRLQQCRDIKYFSPGMTTPAILGNICGDWGIPLDYKWSRQITHEKKVFNGEAVSDIIITLLEEVRQQTGVRYVALYKNGKLTVSDYGTNPDVYVFDTLNTISTADKLSMSSLVTRVKVIGKEDNKGRSSVEAVIDGDLRFGVLQEVIKRDSSKNIGNAMAEARAALKERGKPEENIMLSSPDLPFLRKGDAVEVAAGNLIGTFHVLGVSHNATQQQMTMTLRRKE